MRSQTISSPFPSPSSSLVLGRTQHTLDGAQTRGGMGGEGKEEIGGREGREGGGGGVNAQLINQCTVTHHLMFSIR